MGLYPTQVEAIQKKSSKTNNTSLPSSDLALMTRQLATLVGAGIPLDESLQGVYEQSEKEKQKQILTGVKAKVLEGYSLAQAMAEYPRVFPKIYRATINSSEQSGNLDSVLEELAEYIESQQAIKQKIQQALIYPSLMLIVSFTIIAFLLAFVVPKIIDVFTQSAQTLPIATIILIHASHVIKVYGLYIILIMVAFFFIFMRALKNKAFQYRFDAFLLKMPLISFMIKSVNVSRYIHTFSILFHSGVSVLETMQVSASLLNNQVMKKEFELATVKVREGMVIHQALKQTHFLNPLTLHLIASGEKSGHLVPMMQRAANYLDAHVKRLIETSLTLLEPLIILLMGALVLFIVLATLLPIFSMEQLV